MNSPAFDLADLESIINQGSMPLEVFKVALYSHVYFVRLMSLLTLYPTFESLLPKNTTAFMQNGWYHNVVYLGKEDDIPILTMTCVKRFSLFLPFLIFMVLDLSIVIFLYCSDAHFQLWKGLNPGRFHCELHRKNMQTP